jgi:hypothetical protein
MKFTPHVTRHTWAYLTIKKLYNLQNKRFNGAGNDFVKNSLSIGVMDEAKETLRLLGGWSIKVKCLNFMQKDFYLSKPMLKISIDYYNMILSSIT